MDRTDATRSVMVSPGFSVPGIPEMTLRGVFGERTPDPVVEHFVLIAEYWLAGSPGSPRLARDRILAYSARVTPDNIGDIIRLLASRGYADEFFYLAQPILDEGGQFRDFLSAMGVRDYEIAYYSNWHGLSPDLFAKGFLFGVFESVATVVVDLGRLCKLLVDLQQSQVRTLVLLATDFDAGVASLRQQATAVGAVLEALVAALDPTELPAALVNTWKKWQAEFLQRLLVPDAFGAGRVLGRIGGDLWQLLTGLVAVLKLLRIGAQLGLKFAPMILGSIRRSATESAAVLAAATRALGAIGRDIIDALPRVGLGVLETLFPPPVIKAFSQGRAWLTHGDLVLFPVLRPAYAGAFGDAGGLRTHMGAVVAHQGRPVLMASATQPLVQAGREAVDRRLTDEVLDAILAELDKLPETGPPSPGRLEALRVEAAQAALLAQSLESRIMLAIQSIAWRRFADLVAARTKNLARELGLALHREMASWLPLEVARISPGAFVRTEITLKGLVDAISGSGPALVNAKKARQVLGESVARVLLKHPDHLKYIGFDVAQPTEKALAKFLSEKFRWKANVTVGELQSDAIIADLRTRRLINVDYTASTRADNFETLVRQVHDDLGRDGFDGNWDKVREAYQKAGKQPPADLEKRLGDLTSHAVRETIVRRLLLEELFGAKWDVLSYELTYDGLRKLFARLGKAA